MTVLSITEHRGKFEGALSCTIVALAASFLSENYGAPIMLFALLLGMSANFLYENESCAQGIDFCSSTVLRFGVILLGSRILVTDVLGLGWTTALLVVAGVVTTIGFGAVMARLLGLDRRFGLLSGGAVAICGISAAMTLSSVMPKTRDVEQYTLLTVVMVAMFGAVAMVSYPVISDRLQLDSLEAGIFIGGSIHDVSHVVGASFVLAIVALGIKTSFKGLISIGWRPMALVLAESCFLGLLVAGWVLM